MCYAAVETYFSCCHMRPRGKPPASLSTRTFLHADAYHPIRRLTLTGRVIQPTYTGLALAARCSETMIRNVVKAVGGRVSLKAAAGAQAPTAARAAAVHGLRATSAAGLGQRKGVRSFSEASAPAEGVHALAGGVGGRSGCRVSVFMSPCVRLLTIAYEVPRCFHPKSEGKAAGNRTSLASQLPQHGDKKTGFARFFHRRPLCSVALWLGA